MFRAKKKCKFLHALLVPQNTSEISPHFHMLKAAKSLHIQSGEISPQFHHMLKAVKFLHIQSGEISPHLKW